MKRRILCFLTALSLCLGLCPNRALAAEAEPVLNISEFNSQTMPTAGTFSGDFSGFQWTLDESGTLTISGTGEMPSAYNASWNPYKRDIHKVVVGDGVASIGDGAFYGYADLTQAELPNSVTSIGNSAFIGCTSLNLTKLPDSLTSIGQCAFSGCASLSLTNLPTGVTSIGNEAFQNCTSLALTELPAGITSIGDWGFRSCTKLALTTLPADVTSVGRYAFYGCTSLALTELPNSLASIGDSAFYNCASLTLTTLPESLASIGDSAFNGCTSLTDLTFVSETPPALGGAGIFWWCTNLTIHVPDNDAYTTNWPEDIIQIIAHDITVQNDGNGTASASPASSKAGTTVTLTATPNNGYHFKEWQVISGSVQISDNSFTMPSEDVTIKAVFEENTYTVTVQTEGNGTALASPTSATAGTAITLTATPNSGCHFKEWQVVSGGVTINSNSFTMPAADVTVKAVFEQDSVPDPPQPVQYSVTVQTEGSGTASASPASAEQGTKITLTATPNSGYHFKGWQVISGGVSISGSSFTMPAADVTVKAVFERNSTPTPPPPPPTRYSVRVQTGTGGTASASLTSATAGTKITLTATPDSGYHFKEWQVISGGVTINGSSFTMPAANVTVKAVFEQDSVPDPPQPVQYSVTVQTEGSGTASASPASAEQGTKITLTATPISGYHFKEWQVISGGVTINSGSFTMPAEDVTVKAVFEQDTPPQPETYSITYSANGGGGTMAVGTATAGEAFILPECGFTAPDGKVFDCWHIGGSSGTSVKPGEQYMFTADTAVQAVWKDVPAEPEHVMTGNVIQDGAGVPDAVVTLTSGTQITAVENTDANGCFAFSDVPVGTYNLKVEKDGITKTIKQEITSENINLTIILPNGKTNSVVEVKNEETPPVIVGGLEQVFEDSTVYTPEDQKIVDNGGAVEFKLTVEKQDAPQEAAKIEGVKKAGETVALYLDLTLTKTVTHSDGTGTSTKVPKIQTLIETIIPLPVEMQGKGSYTVYRVHNGVAEALPRNQGSEYYTVSSGKTSISVFASRYSIYAIAWSDKTETPPQPPVSTRPSGGGSGVRTYAVRVEPSEHGKVTTSRSYAADGTTVTLTVTPDAGYVLRELTVTDSQGGALAVTEKNTFVMPGRDVTVKAVFSPEPKEEEPVPAEEECPSSAYTDLDAGAWYHEAVDYVIREELLTGFGDGTFQPDGNLSRAQLAQILYNREGKPAVTGGSGFTDVSPGAWYAPAVTWAAARGIAGGYGNGRFGPNDRITREQLAVMLWRYAKEPAAANQELRFRDAAQAGVWSLEALRWAAEHGILNGKGSGILDPKGMTTRAETAQMLYNLMKQ